MVKVEISLCGVNYAEECRLRFSHWSETELAKAVAKMKLAADLTTSFPGSLLIGPL